MTPKKVYTEGLSYSWSTIDSEDGSSVGANCYRGWSFNDRGQWHTRMCS
ncbi:MAG: hypothetical protein QNL01_02740 [Akkermansiaceae bacterium]|jgi:hypothetical protein